MILVPLAVVVFVTSTAVLRPDGTEALSAAQSGTSRTIAFLVGCAMSGLTGFIGMGLAVRGNLRTAAAARTGSLPASLRVAFRTGGVAGMFTLGPGLLGATVIILAFQNTASTILIGFGFGGSLLALFLRVGGGNSPRRRTWAPTWSARSRRGSRRRPPQPGDDRGQRRRLRGDGDGNLQYALYLVALCGMGMLATTGVVVSEDTFGPVADNAAGIAEMAGEFDGEAERIMVALDAAGNRQPDPADLVRRSDRCLAPHRARGSIAPAPQ